MRDFFEREIKRHNNRKQKLTERKEQNRLLQLKLQKAQQDIEELHTKLKNYEKEIKRLRKKNTKYRGLLEQQMSMLKTMAQSSKSKIG